MFVFQVQGLELEKIESGEGYTGIVHGTYDAAWESIRRQVGSLLSN